MNFKRIVFVMFHIKFKINNRLANNDWSKADKPFETSQPTGEREKNSITECN